MIFNWLGRLSGLPVKVRIKQPRFWQFECRAGVSSYMQQKVGNRSYLLLAFLLETLGCFTFYTQTSKRALSWDVQRQQGKLLIQWTWAASIFLWVLAGIPAARCLCEEENRKVLNTERTKEAEKTKRVGFAQKATIRPERESNKGSGWYSSGRLEKNI